MKAISLWQPWATLWVLGEKQAETRHWNTNYRGELAIHAAKRFVKSEAEEYWEDEYFRRALFKYTMGTNDFKQYLDFGAIVGVVNLNDCKRVEEVRIFVSAKEAAFGNYSDGRFAWIGKNHFKLPIPVPAKGFQGFWDLPPDVEARVREQLTTQPSHA